MYVSAIVLAAGKGVRLKSKIPKPLIRINSQPLIIYCLKALCKHPFIRDVVVVVKSQTLGSITGIIKKYRLPKIKDIIEGGLRRQDSVFNGLKAMDRKTDLVLVHDAARPFIDKNIISSLIRKAQNYGAAIAAVPVKATIKEVQGTEDRGQDDFIVKKTLERNNLWEVQTPQVFRRDLILRAYKKFSKIQVTDDAGLVEKLGHKVRVVFGSYDNIKITTPGDLAIAKAIYGQNRNRLRYSPSC